MAVALSVPACASPPSAASSDRGVYVDGTDIVLQGATDEVMVREFMRTVKSTPTARAVRITSAGGNGPAAIKIANLIYDRNLIVKVDQYCISSCAQFILASGRKKEIGKDSVVGFHGTSTALQQILLRSRLADGAKHFDYAASAEKSLYRKIGVDDSFLLSSDQYLERICVLKRSSKSLDPADAYGAVHRYVTFLPAKKSLLTAGFSGVSGDWPVSQADVDRRLAKLPFNANFSVRFVPDFALTQRLPNQSVDECNDEILTRLRTPG